MRRALFASALVTSLLLTTARLASANCATDSATGAMVLAAREAANLACPCATFTNHGTYMKCVAHIVKTLSSGANPSLPPSCKGAVKRCAAHSTCGRPKAVTCCFATTTGTTCKIVAENLCTPPRGGTGGGTCTSCCDACSTSGNGPSCPTTTTPTTTTTLPFLPCGAFPTCNGTCPAGMRCVRAVFPPVGRCGCANLPVCGGQPPNCGGNCPPGFRCLSAGGTCLCG